MFYLANYLLITHTTPYYYNPNIHNFGNIGLGGKIHANLSPFATKMIDIIRYDNKDIRKELMTEYKDNTILDLCCGTGFSTYDNAIGIDTSNEMLNIAKKLKTNKNKKFYYGNAENYIPDCNIDIVSCMFAFHEMPLFAQFNVIDNAFKIANKEIVIVDISPDYKPSQIMLSGEPYLNNYLNNIKNILYDYEFKETILIPNHVHIWKKKIY